MKVLYNSSIGHSFFAYSYDSPPDHSSVTVQWNGKQTGLGNDSPVKHSANFKTYSALLPIRLAFLSLQRDFSCRRGPHFHL